MSGTVVVLPGAAAVNWRGTWSSTTTYAPNDAVYFNGASYICIRTNTGAQPDISPTSWQPNPLQTGAGGSVVITGSPTTGQLLQAVSNNLINGIFGFDEWVPASKDHPYRLALNSSINATTLSGALLAYMQAATTGNPPGLGMSPLAASTMLATLMAQAVAYPR